MEERSTISGKKEIFTPVSTNKNFANKFRELNKSLDEKSMSKHIGKMSDLNRSLNESRTISAIKDEKQMNKNLVKM